MIKKKDDRTDCEKAISKFCHDIGDIVGVLGGYSGIFNMIAENRVSVNDTYVIDLIQRVKDNRHATETKFNTIIERMKSKSAECEDIFNDLSDRATALYHSEYDTWYVLVSQLEAQYSTTNLVDKQLVQQLDHHANELAAFRQSMLDQLQKK